MKHSPVRLILAMMIAITLAACSTSAPPAAPGADVDIELEGLAINSATAKLAPRAQVASDALQASIEKFSSSELVVKPSSSANARASSLAVGDIVISEPTADAPSGMFVRVTGVQKSGSVVDYDVTQASFEEAFESLNLDMTKELSSSELVAAVGPQGLGGSSELTTQGTLFDIDASFANYVICDSDGNTATTNDQIKINGTFKADVKTFAKISVKNYKTELFEAGASLDEQLNLGVKGTCGKSYAKEWLIKEYKFKTFTVVVGNVPIVMTPNVKLYVGSKGEVKAEVDITATQTLKGRYGVRYGTSSGWDAIKETTQTRTAKANKLQGSAQARAYIGPKAGVTFYGTATGWGYPKGFVDAKASVVLVPSPAKVDYCLSAGINFSAGADLKLNLLVKKIDKSWSKDFGDVLKYQILCDKIAYTPPTTPTPTNPTTPTPVTTGKLSFTVVPSGILSGLTVKGNGNTYSAQNGTTLTLSPGTYTISGGGYDSNNNIEYVAPTQSVSVLASQTKTVTVYMNPK